MHYRLAQPSDAAVIAAIYAPFVADSHVSFELMPPDEAEISRRVADTLRDYPWLVAEENGEVLGYAYGSPYRTRPAYRWSAEVSVYLAEHARGKGIGRSLYQYLFRLLRAQNVCCLVGGIALPNAASVRLHEALGFQAVGAFPRVGYKQGRWVDVGFWTKWIGPEDPTIEPAEFIAFADLDPRHRDELV